ncbi:hypothetical protein [Streptomyces sp. HC307]
MSRDQFDVHQLVVVQEESLDEPESRTVGVPYDALADLLVAIDTP